MRAGPAVSVRRTVEADWESLRAVRLRALADSPSAFGTSVAEAEAQPELLWRDRARGTDIWRSFVAEAGDEIVGLVAVAVDPDLAGHLISMWVDPRFRGTSAAADLVGAAVAWARVRGLGRVRLSVMRGNERALGFYRRCGFVATGITTPLRTDPSRMTEEMVLDL